MTDEQITAVRMIRQEADRLRLACVNAAKAASLLHVAYDQEIVASLPLDQTVLLGALGAAR